jgi:hypothetical protein
MDRVVGEGRLYLLHPIRFQHGISVDPAEDLTRGVIKAEITGGYQALGAVLAEQDDRTLRVLELHLPHDVCGPVGREVVHHYDFVRRNGLVHGGDQALPNDAFLVVCRDDNRHSRRRHSKVQGFLGGSIG